MAAATGQLSASPKPKSTPPIATTIPCSGRPRMMEATPIVSGMESACDDRGRIPDSRPARPLNGISTIQQVDPGRGVDDDRPAPFGTASKSSMSSWPTMRV